MGEVCKPECWTLRTCKDAATIFSQAVLVTEEDLGPKGIRINGQNFIIRALHLFCLAVAVNDNQYFLHTHRA